MTIESALREMEYKAWCEYNHEHINEYGKWVMDDEENDELTEEKE